MSVDLKNWKVTIEGVTAEDMKDLAEKAGKCGLSVGSLLGNFINDLVCGAATNGSDERMYACQWFERCGFSMFSDNTFLCYLIEWGGLEAVIYAHKEIQQSEEYIKQIETELAAGKLVCHKPKDNGEFLTWEDIVFSGGEPCYPSKEAWEADERKSIKDEQDSIKELREIIAEHWQEYIEQGTGDYTPGTFEEELKKVLEWECKNREFLGE